MQRIQKELEDPWRNARVLKKLQGERDLVNCGGEDKQFGNGDCIYSSYLGGDQMGEQWDIVSNDGYHGSDGVQEDRREDQCKYCEKGIIEFSILINKIY